MMRLIWILSIVGYLALSHSARGEHSGDGAGPRRTVPAISATQRFSELVSACQVGRPFPSLRTKEVGGETGGVPLPDSAPVLTDNGGSTGGSGGSTGGGTSGGSSAGGDAVFGKCIGCHSGGATSFTSGIAGVTSRISSGEMPQSGTPLTAEEQQSLITYLQEQGLK